MILHKLIRLYVLETHVPTSTLGEYVSFHILFKGEVIYSNRRAVMAVVNNIKTNTDLKDGHQKRFEFLVLLLSMSTVNHHENDRMCCPILYSTQEGPHHSLNSNIAYLVIH